MGSCSLPSIDFPVVFSFFSPFVNIAELLFYTDMLTGITFLHHCLLSFTSTVLFFNSAALRSFFFLCTILYTHTKFPCIWFQWCDLKPLELLHLYLRNMCQILIEINRSCYLKMFWVELQTQSNIFQRTCLWESNNLLVRLILAMTFITLQKALLVCLLCSGPAVHGWQSMELHF